ncbi:MAG: HAMP domain-containing histidine kinase [Acidimicrobiia bacterium]|nr:HAMP domain-containing histidine kinase [Acidimicrobiia bacterium]
MQWGKRAQEGSRSQARPLYVDALAPLYPKLAEGYPPSSRPPSSKIAYVLFLFTWPMMLLAIAGIWGDAPLLSAGTTALMLVVMIQARRLAYHPKPQSAGLLGLVALSALVSIIVALREGVDSAVAGRAELVIIVVIGFSAVLLSDRQPLLISLGWSLFPAAGIALPLYMLGLDWQTTLIESSKATFAFMAGAVLMRVIHTTLKERQDRYARLLELSAIGIMELDLTRVAAAFRTLAMNGVDDIAAWLEEKPQRTYEVVGYCDVTNLNETMATMLGVDHNAEEVRKRTALISSPSVAETMKTHLIELWQGAETAATQAEVVNKLGHARALIMHTARRRTEAGFDNAHVVLTAVDVEDRREAENELQRQVARREQLIASVSHELRTPMASVIGFADELIERPTDFSDAERKELLEMIRSQSVDVANILDDLLVKARADFNDVAVMCDEVDVTAVVGRLLEELGMAEIKTELNGVVVWADRTRLRQILRNLLTNARRYGGPKVRVYAENRDDSAYISVRDSGEPLDLETSRSIFEAFERAHETSGVTASVGLGLTIARQLAQAMNGEVWYAHDGQEAAFTVALPIAAPIEPEQVVEAPAPQL